MEFEDNIGRRIARKFGSEKIITGIKNNNMRIKFLKYYWALPLIPTLGILLNMPMFLALATSNELVLLLTGFVIALLVTIFSFLGSFYELYFENNFLILENKLKMKKYIDINKCPRIYIRQHVYTVESRTTGTVRDREEYILYIEQQNVQIKLNVRTKGVEELIDNFVTKSILESTQDEFDSSGNEEEVFFLNCMKIINKKGRVVGIKDTNQNLKMKKGSNKNSIILYVLMVISIIVIIWAAILDIYEIVIGFSLLMLLFVVLLIRERFKNTLKISYLEDGWIKINRYFVNYTDDILEFNINAFQTPHKKKKYNYSLAIHDNNKDYGILINRIEQDKFEMFINNLIFDNK